MTENEMVGWHHQFNGHEFKQGLGIGDGHEFKQALGSFFLSSAIHEFK